MDGLCLADHQSSLSRAAKPGAAAPLTIEALDKLRASARPGCFTTGPAERPAASERFFVDLNSDTEYVFFFKTNFGVVMNEKQKGFAQQEAPYRPTEVEFLAGLVSKTAKIQEKSAAWPMSIRVPVGDFSSVKALSEYSGKSMNTIAVHLIRVGLEALFDELPEDESAAIRVEANRMHWETRKGDSACPNYEATDQEEAA